MRCVSWVKETRREYLRAKKRELKIAKKSIRMLSRGCVLHDIYDGTTAYFDAMKKAREAINEIEQILKSLSY
jgi:hypothetical protein